MLVDNRGRRARVATEVITREAWAARWPFTTATAVLVCAPELRSGGAMVVVDGQPWAAQPPMKGFEHEAPMRRNFGVVIAALGRMGCGG